MICLEVLVNGEPACTAGGYLTLLNLILGQDADHPHNFLRVTSVLDAASDLAPKLRAALQTRVNQHHEWLYRNVQPGDEITIRIIDRDESESPVKLPEPTTGPEASSN